MLIAFTLAALQRSLRRRGQFSLPSSLPRIQKNSFRFCGCEFGGIRGLRCKGTVAFITTFPPAFWYTMPPKTKNGNSTNTSTSRDHGRDYYDDSIRLCGEQKAFSKLGDWPCPKCGPNTKSRPHLAFCHTGCGSAPSKEFCSKQSKAQENHYMAVSLRPGAAPYVPPKKRRRAKASGDTGDAALEAEKAKNKKLQAWWGQG